jgi:hypothetical protein
MFGIPEGPNFYGAQAKEGAIAQATFIAELFGIAA